MSGSKTKTSGTFLHPKRAYLFGLLTIVLFVGLNLLFPSSKPLKQTSVSIEFTHDGSEHSKQSTQQALLDELKTQLSLETLAQTLDSVSQKTEISSKLFVLNTDSQFDVDSIRSTLISGGLSVEKLSPTPSSTDQSNAAASGSKNNTNVTGPSESMATQPMQTAGFRLSIVGSGTEDELLFVKLLAKKIKDSVSPDYDRDQIKSEIASIRDGIVTSTKMNKTLRDSVSDTFQKYTQRQKQLLASASAGPRESSELQRMRRAQEQCVQEYRRNELNGYGKDSNVQADLESRIETWTIEIKKQREKESEKEKTDYQRLANNGTGVERATFVDNGVSGIQPFELEQEVSNLKTEVALLVGKIDIAAKQNSENLEISSKLTQILESGKESTVRISEPNQTSVWSSPKSMTWFVIASVLISGVIVGRIRSNAFANHFVDQGSIEESLQLPVIDQISLPASTEKEDTKIIIQQTKWVRLLTKTCEVVLLVGVVGIVCLLLVQSDSAKQFLFQPTSFFQ